MAHAKRAAIRIPARLLFYMDSTGWGQGSEADAAEAAADPARAELLRLMAHAPTNADGSVTVHDPSDAMLARLWFEADHLTDFVKYGDVTPDTLADANAGRAMIRRIAACYGRELGGMEVREVIYNGAEGFAR